MTGADLRYCSATSQSNRCDRRYDHEGDHHDRLHDVEWPPVAPPEKPVYGMCLACRAVEVALVEVTGTRDLSSMGEHPEYPVGYGCEACS